MIRRAVFAGSFDPPTLGHTDIIERAAALFDELLVVAAHNSQKKSFFSLEERIEMLERLTQSLKNVHIFGHDSLVTDFMKEQNALILVRGLRAQADFAYEMEIAAIYKAIDPRIETIFIPSNPKFLAVRSSTVKELAMFHVDVSSMVPPLVLSALYSHPQGCPTGRL
ncbi:MAG: pantetheine-phosphate adenylyltransferase [Treponema sp.]|jgi:pantetheine-phosphate adenylyltransferase|nr:pantetheine-phosphate adenylyltransferase [Treponema sp.]